VESIRRAFDESFAVAAAPETAEAHALLRIVVSGDAYALRLPEISELFVDRTITAVPGPLRELLGIAGLRNGIVPIYDLGSLLGYASRGDTGRWLVVTRNGAELGFAFEELIDYLRVPSQAISASPGQTERAHVREVVRHGEELIPILSLRSLAESLTERTRLPTSTGPPERSP
jgi:chemotaxis signal transduction protein